MQQRSRAYPAVNLETAIQLLEKLVEVLGWGACDRDEAAEALGYRGSTGLAARKVAALAHFGLLDRRGGRYLPSSLAEKLLHPESESHYDASLKEAFLEPALFKEVVDHHAPIGQIPDDFPEALTSLHGITSSACTEVANLFMESAIFARIISPDGAFIDAKRFKLDKQAATTPEIHVDEEKGSVISSEIEGVERQILKLTLPSGDHARLDLPKFVSSADVELLRKMIEVIDLQVEKGESPRPLRWVKSAGQNRANG